MSGQQGFPQSGVAPGRAQVPGRAGSGPGSGAPAAALLEMLDVMKGEIELLVRENISLKGEREEFERKSAPLFGYPPFCAA
jgi:hypothetical protein